ncbi:MAG: hypothetical protein M1820_000318 [Bogoriella megaspora]|nr:MAG: hypothetical protein M1820_000318 [Bogoriella megaspora]
MPAMKEAQPRFKTIQQFKTDYAPAIFSQYESTRTGMRVVVVDQKGPKVYGYFALATEILDDSGAPHTLEHLCFMGSKSYKYKGVLDKLATRAYSSTNAWTATDHTAYTLETAGWEGFAQILPVYLEHVLVPTLTDAGCLTEVYHVDGSGNDAGVVYSEMQGVQNTASELMDVEARRVLYPEGIGFRYETGGMMHALRKLTADRIREFHREMYQPKNLCLVLIGEVYHTDLLSILDEFEDSILEDIPPPDAPFKRPWVESKQAPALNETIVKKVTFPEEDETTGEISIGFFGPDCDDHKLTTAMDVVLSYLAGSSVGVLENTLVEKEQVCSTVWYNTDVRPKTVVWFTLTGVETEKLQAVNDRFFEILRETVSKPLDMEYLSECLKRFIRQIKYGSEDSANFFADVVIQDHLFGKRNGLDLREVENLNTAEGLAHWTEGEWQSFLRQWLSDAHHVSILGTPSAEMSERLDVEEKARVEALKERLGEDGLRQKQEELDAAKAENDEEIPEPLLKKFEVPGTDSIHFIPTTTARSGLAKDMGRLDNGIQDLIDKKASELPLFIHFEHIPSNFVSITLVMTSSSVPVKLKPLLSLFISNFFNTPVTRDGKKLDFEEATQLLEGDTVGYSFEPGPSNSELLQVRFQVESDKYETAIRWMKTYLFDSIFEKTRLQASLAKMLADIPEEKRSGSQMLRAVDSMVHFSQLSSGRARNTLSKALYLKRLSRLLEENPDKVIADLESVRKTLCRFSNFRVLVASNVETLPDPVAAWQHLTTPLDTNTPLESLGKVRDVLSERGQNPGGTSYIVPISAIDSSYALLTSRGLDSYTHPKLPALMVATSYLDAVEGPMWGAVRGNGLAYGTNFLRSVEAGWLSFNFYRSPDAFKAFQLAREQVEGYANGSKKFDELALEGAISSIVMGFADTQPTMGSAATVSFINQVITEVGKDFNDEMLKNVRAVTVEHLKEVMEELVLPIFRPESADLIVTCAPIMQEALLKNFEEVGFRPKIQPLTTFYDDYGLKGIEGEDDLEEEDEDEDEDEEDGEDGDECGEDGEA